MRVIRIGDCDSHSEQEFADELANWKGAYHIPGIALIQLHSPVCADAVVLTPTGPVLVEVKGLRRGASGVISVPAQGTWTDENGPLDLCLSRARSHQTSSGAVNPLGQASKYARDLRNRLRQHPGLPDTYVKGLVVLVQSNRNRPVRLTAKNGVCAYSSENLGLAVTTLTRFGGNKPLRHYFRERAAETSESGTSQRMWTTAEAKNFFHALGIDPNDPACALTDEVLRQEGFREALSPVTDSTVYSSANSRADSRADSRAGSRTGSRVDSTADATADVTAGLPTWGELGGGSTSVPTPPEPAVKPALPPHALAPKEPGAPAAWVTSAKTAAGCLLTLAVVGALLFGGFKLVSGWFAEQADQDESKPTVNETVTISTPSRNIVCRMTGAGTSCDIDRVHYGMKSVPQKCKGSSNWGHSFAITPAKGVQLTCPKTRMTTKTHTTTQLEWNDSKTVGDVTCMAQETGLTCSTSKHGFTLRRGGYRTW